MANEPASRGWAEEEFGAASLGDSRRTRRLVRIAGHVASTPGGKVTEVFVEPAEREATFRLLENDEVSPTEMSAAASAAAAARCRGQSFAFVPVDETSLNLADPSGRRGLGSIGARTFATRGLCVMTALAVLPDGTPTGVSGQAYWAREGRARGHHKTRRIPVEEKETRYWLEVIGKVREAFERQAPTTQPWFQMDRGGDAWPIFVEAAAPGCFATIRATHDRRIRTDEVQQKYLWETVAAVAPIGSYSLDVPAISERQALRAATAVRHARRAFMELRICKVTLDLVDQRSKRSYGVAVTALLARESETVPDGETPLEWMLLTTYPVATADDAQLVLFGYAQRWRIEEFHRMWKSGACRVEETQLHDRAHILRWAIVLASVAARMLRLSYYARTTPQAPAQTEFNDAEVKAILLAKKQPPTAPVTIAKAVLWLAEIGGYVTSSATPPGPLNLARGLRKIELLAELISDGIVKM